MKIKKAVNHRQYVTYWYKSNNVDFRLMDIKPLGRKTIRTKDYPDIKLNLLKTLQKWPL